MRIGIDAHDLEGERTGTGRYLLNILRYWPAIVPPHTEVFLYFKKEVPELPELAESIFKSRLLPSVFGRQSAAGFIHISLPRAAKADKIDVLWCPAYIAPLWSKGKLVLTLHDVIFDSSPDLYDWPSPADRILLAWVARRAAKRAIRIFTPSEFTKKEVARLYGVPEDRVAVTPLAADAQFSQTPDAQEIQRTKRRYGLSGAYFLYYGSIFKRRHVSDCIDAFLGVQNRFPDTQFLIGGGDYSGAGIMRKAALHHAEGVRYTPYIASGDLPALLKGAAALLYLSEYEGFGLPVVEAMMVGTPVITSRSGSLAEVAMGCALYIRNPSDVTEISAAMQQILNDTDFARNLAECGKERARQFSWEACAQKTLEAIVRTA